MGCQVPGLFGSCLSGDDLRRQNMAIDTFDDYGEPGSGGPGDRGDSSLEEKANASLEGWLGHHPAVARELKETTRAHIHLQELGGRTREADQAAQEAEQHEATLATKLDPAGHRVLGFALGTVLVILLVGLDGVPLNWAAQAFDLNSAGTWLVTLILVVASIGAMLGFEVTRRHARQRGLLVGVVAAAYVALLGLRTEFLITVASESLPVALLQATLLTAISAGLVLCGSAVLGRTRPLKLSQARAAAQRTRQDAAEARVTQNQAAERLQRHIGGLRQMLLPWALGSPAPTGIDRAKWTAALEKAVRALFPEP
jgi:hypothetical protein